MQHKQGFFNDEFIRISKKFWSTKTLINLLTLNKIWYDRLINEDEIKAVVKLQIDIRNIIKHNTDVYDNFTYKRKILKTVFSPTLQLYKNLNVPYITCSYSEDDLDEDEPNSIYLIYYIAEKRLPNELLIFLSEYEKTPDPRVNVFQPEYITRFIRKATQELNKLKLYTSSKPQYTNMVFLIPVCYSKHYKHVHKDANYVSVLCYVHIIDTEIEDKLVNKSNRYIILHIGLKNLDETQFILNEVETYINSIYTSLTTNNNKEKLKEFYYYQDILNISENFVKCLTELVKRYQIHI
jgi:hypothetical protein